MGRSLVELYLGVPTLLLLPLALSRPAGLDAAGIVLVALAAVAVLGALLARRAAPSRPLFIAALTLAALLVSAGVALSPGAGAAYALLYAWIAACAGLHLPRAAALALTAVAATAWAVALAGATDPGIDSSGWLVGSAVLAALTLRIGAATARAQRLARRLDRAARTDALTGLLNRGAFDEALELEVERARRGGHAVSIVIGDLDHFKHLNDRQGHAAGDSALRRLSAIWSEGKRRIDTVARIGGEEFAMVMPETDTRGAYVLGERLRSDVEALFAEDEVPSTISFGIASFPAHGDSPRRLLEAADEALYAAKELGRNRSVMYSGATAGILSGAASQRAAQREVQLRTVLTLAEALDLREPGAARHGRGCAAYAEMIAEQLGLSAARVERVRLAGVVHDIGKIAVRGTALTNPGPLSSGERIEIQRHPEIGARILEDAQLDDIRGWVLAHHERPDGGGYPLGLSRLAIPLEARILAVADAYEAMLCQRAYRDALDETAARAELRRGAGTQFDPEAVGALLRRLDAAGEQAAAA